MTSVVRLRQCRGAASPRGQVLGTLSPPLTCGWSRPSWFYSSPLCINWPGLNGRFEKQCKAVKLKQCDHLVSRHPLVTLTGDEDVRLRALLIRVRANQPERAQEVR